MSFQCPSKLVAMLGKDSPSQEAIKGSKQLEIQEEICEPVNANLKVNVDDANLNRHALRPNKNIGILAQES